MNFVALDVETANADLSSICQIGLAFFEAGQLVRVESKLIDPEDFFDGFNIRLHGIDEDAVEGEATFLQAYSWLLAAISQHVVVTHTAFDVSAIRQACARYSLPVPDVEWIDSARVARRVWEWCARSGYGLADLAERFGIEFRHHDAGEDAAAAGKILLRAGADAGLDLAGVRALLGRPITSAFVDRLDELAPNAEGDFFGQTIVFTGQMSLDRIDAARRAAELGFTVDAGVTKRTDILVVGDQDLSKLAGHKKSNKHRKAEDMQSKGKPIRILKETDFLDLLRV